MHQNFNTLLQTINKHKLFPVDSIVIVAVSGGADSIALLHWLAHHKDQLRIHLHVATLDHSLRASAKDDIQFVQHMAHQLNLPCKVGIVNVPKLAAQRNIGIEAAARYARYEFLAETAHAISTNYIATAHHADDQSETIMIHLLRGSGTNGLAGMQMQTALPAHPTLTLLRPLLHISRQQIETYCEDNQLVYRTDETNFDTQYLRNELRHEILPRLRQINPQFDSALARLANIVTVEQDFLTTQYQQTLKVHASFSDRVTLNLNQFQSAHPAMQRWFIIDALSHLKVEPVFQQILHAIQVATKGEVGQVAEFTGDAQLRIGYEALYVEPVSLPLPTEDYVQISAPIQLTIPSQTVIGQYQLHISREEIDNYTACMYIAHDANIILRTRKPGDRFQPRGMNGHSQKIKKWLIDNKIPSFVRDRLPLVIIGNTIGAIMLPQGWRIAEPFAKNEMSQCNVYFKVSKLL